MKKVVYFTIVMLIVFNGLCLFLTEIPPVYGQYIPHDPIQIYGDSDFSQTALDEGWEGNGTPDNPYIIKGYEIEGEGHGIEIRGTTLHFIISNSRISYKGSPSGSNQTDQSGIYIYSVRNGMVNNCIIENNEYGIYIKYSQDVSITNNTIINNNQGIYSSNSHTNNINDNTISLNKFNGIYLRNSRRNNIGGNNISSNKKDGIHIYDSYWNQITNNIFLFNENYGIEILYSKQNAINNNQFQSNIEDGIRIFESTEIDISNNSMLDNGIRLGGRSLDYVSTNNIDSSNTINGKSFYYAIDQVGGLVPPNVGQIILINCTEMRIEKQEITHSSIGIYLYDSSNITVIDNKIKSNSKYGIYLFGSSNNSISYNVVSNNEQGIYFEGSNNNTIIFNTVSSNNVNGIFLIDSTNNTFHHNNIIDNDINEAPFPVLNTWSDGYGKGNYWSDYNGFDLNGDGVGDTKLPHRGVDDHPLMNPTDSRINENLPIFYYMFFLALLILAILSILVMVRLRRKKKRTKTQNPDEPGNNSSKSRAND